MSSLISSKEIIEMLVGLLNQEASINNSIDGAVKIGSNIIKISLKQMGLQTAHNKRSLAGIFNLTLDRMTEDEFQRQIQMGNLQKMLKKNIISITGDNVTYIHAESAIEYLLSKISILMKCLNNDINCRNSISNIEITENGWFKISVKGDENPSFIKSAIAENMNLELKRKDEASLKESKNGNQAISITGSNVIYVTQEAAIRYLANIFMFEKKLDAPKAT